MNRLRGALRLLGAVGLGALLVFAVQIPVTRLWGLLGISWSRENLPLAADQQIAALLTLFLAILCSTLGAALAAGRLAIAALSILVLIGVSIDGYAMFVKLAGALPLWFRAAFVLQIPLATVCGWFLIRKRLPS